jgi:adenylate cyclase
MDRHFHMIIVHTHVAALSSELFSPHIVHFLKKYFNEANKIIHKNDGILDKFIGDGVMAYFGYYDNAGNQAGINAVNAAIELREKFVVIKNEWIEKLNLNPKNLETNVKCGIHTAGQRSQSRDR